MSELELNKIVASILVAGLIFMAISVGVDELWHETALESPVYPVPEMAAGAPAEEAAPTAVASLASLLAMADVDAGKKTAKKCGACHDVKKGGPNKVGPNIWNIVGARQAGVSGYRYSSALKGLGGTWDYAALDAFLLKPRAYAKRTKMSFAGIAKAKDRANLIGYLRGLSDNPKPLP